MWFRLAAGKIIDQYRIDCTLATMYNVVERGGRPILMTHCVSQQGGCGGPSSLFMMICCLGMSLFLPSYTIKAQGEGHLWIHRKEHRLSILCPI